LIDFVHAAEFEILVLMFFIVLYFIIQDLTSQPDYGGVFESRPQGVDVLGR
jgi:hypothetical protein